MSEEIICTGCGVAIQTENKDQLGYAPKSALEKEVIICQRCFRLRHYNDIQDVSLTDDDFLKMLTEIGETDALVVYLVDIFDFNGSWVPGLQRFVGHNDVLLVGNKVDLLPKSVNRDRMKNWMRGLSKELGLKPLDVSLISANTGEGIEALADQIDHYRNGKDVFVVGCTNVGKSTFINKIIQMFSGDDRFIITTSRFPGTTLDFIDIPLDDGQSIVDTPGVINHHQMAHYVNNHDLKLISPSKEIKPKSYQLNEQQTLFFGGLGRIDYLEGGHRSLICYFSNELYIHRTKTETADELYQRQLGDVLQPPSDNVNELPPLVKHEFNLKGEMDVVFSGLGWVTVKGENAKVAAFAPKGVGVSIRRSLI